MSVIDRIPSAARRFVLLLVSTWLCNTPAMAQSGGGYDMKWNSVDGGAQSSTAGNFKLIGIIGQPDAGTMSGGGFKFNGGFLVHGSEICPSSSAPIAEMIGDETSTKNRFLSFTAGDSGRTQAVRVTFVDLPSPFHTWNGAELWVGPTSEVSQNGASVDPLPGFANFNAATLQCDSFYADWSAVGVVHIFHEGIVPLGSYRIQVIEDSEACDAANEAHFSAPLDLVAAKWGDTITDLSTEPPGPPDGINNITDIFAVIGRFSSADGSIVKPRADLEPGCLDLLINITDVLSGIVGFQGLGYPFEPTAADPCDSTCANPLP